MRKVAFRVIIAMEANSNSSEEKMPIIWNHPVFLSSTVCFYTSARPRERISPLIIIMGRLFAKYFSLRPPFARFPVLMFVVAVPYLIRPVFPMFQEAY